MPTCEQEALCWTIKIQIFFYSQKAHNIGHKVDLDLFLQQMVLRLATEENYKQFVIRANNIHSTNQVTRVLMTLNVTVNYEISPNQNSKSGLS